MTQKAQNILIACGGTGGHLFPGIAVAQTLRKQGHQPILLISQKKIDSIASEKYPELEFIPVPAIAMPKLLSFKTPIFFVKLLQAILGCRRLIKTRKIDAVLGMGGFTSLPPVLAAKLNKIPAFVHDSNALPGKANRLTARWCKKVLLGMKNAKTYFPNSITELTGTPVREELCPLPNETTAREKLEISDSCPLVLVIGGSQGAKNLNTQVIDTAKELDPKLCSFLLVTGPADFERCQNYAKDLSNLKLIKFCTEMPCALAAAKLAIARSGASTLTEFAHAGLPSVLVPYPFAADDHQTFNAKEFSECGASVLIPEKELTPKTLGDFLNSFFNSNEISQKMSKAAHSLARPDAAENIVRTILDA